MIFIREMYINSSRFTSIYGLRITIINTKSILLSALHQLQLKTPHISFGVSRIIVHSVLFCAYMYMYKCLENRNFQLGGVFSGDEQTRLSITTVSEGKTYDHKGK